MVTDVPQLFQVDHKAIHLETKSHIASSRTTTTSTAVHVEAPSTICEPQNERQERRYPRSQSSHPRKHGPHHFQRPSTSQTLFTCRLSHNRLRSISKREQAHDHCHSRRRLTRPRSAHQGESQDLVEPLRVRSEGKERGRGEEGCVLMHF